MTTIFRAATSGRLASLALLCLTLALPAWADPPGRIGRIAWLAGSAQVSSRDGGAPGGAQLNQPLTSGDTLVLGPNARAEVEIGSITLRFDADSEVDFDRIDDEAVRVFLDHGRAIVRLATPDALREFAIETREGEFGARRSGVFRFDSDERSTVATAYNGSLRFRASDTTADMDAGQSTQFWYDGGQTRTRQLASANDDFSQWSALRDQRYPGGEAARYVSPEMTGAGDLDTYGSWRELPEYGAIWYPHTLAADWAPYRYGHWVWVAPWGWTWVAQEPWGFAPFHYGRWLYHGGRWGWVPGRRVARPVYAPALVSWIGGGVSVTISSRPTVGWFPLAPREVYVPAYRTSPTYVRNVNITHVTQINNVTTIVNNPDDFVRRTRYAHRELPQAVTVVPSDVVAQRRPVAGAALPVRDRRLLREQAVSAVAPVAAPLAATAPNGERAGRRERGGDRTPRFVAPEGGLPAGGEARLPGREREPARRIEREAPREERGRERQLERPAAPPATPSAAIVPAPGPAPTPAAAAPAAEAAAPVWRRERAAPESARPEPVRPAAEASAPILRRERAAPQSVRPEPSPPAVAPEARPEMRPQVRPEFQRETAPPTRQEMRREAAPPMRQEMRREAAPAAREAGRSAERGQRRDEPRGGEERGRGRRDDGERR